MDLRKRQMVTIDKSFTKKPFMGTMKMDFFKEIIDECYANGTKAITLASRGEPTLHPKLPEMLDYISNKLLRKRLIVSIKSLSWLLVILSILLILKIIIFK